MGTAVGVPLSTRETVDWETPVASAMSRMVGAAPLRLVVIRVEVLGWLLRSLLLIGSPCLDRHC